jgi:hypothetical protein
MRDQYNEQQKKPKLARIATELEDGRKMRKVHLAYLIAREYAKMVCIFHRPFFHVY